MMDTDLDDTHLCIKCSSAIVGLPNYIQHRKSNCSVTNLTSSEPKLSINSQTNNESQHEISGTMISTTTNTNLDHTYDSFSFHEPEPPLAYVSKSEHGGKTTKSLNDAYDLPYELGADVFFSSLQLQSVQSTGTAQSTSGKTGSMQQPQVQLQRQKSHQEHTAHVEAGWIETHAGGTSGQHKNTETLMTAFISDMGESKKPYESVFKHIPFVHESPDVSEDEDEDEEEIEMGTDDEDEDYDPIAASHASGGKWKLPLIRHSPPVVPVTHTGGKWKPENRPNLRVTHTQLTRLSPNWDIETGTDEVEPTEADTAQHPPAEYTKGKWIPGTKLQRLEYKEEVELAKSSNQDFWCNICCKKLKNKFIYENHLKTSYHLKRSEPEQQLEKAELDELQHSEITKSFAIKAKELPKSVSRKRKRRAKLIKCDLCKHTMSRHLIGKHLISHFHYRHMQKSPNKSLPMILEHIHSIVLQSPYQCHPCRFYANTEETFLRHWNSLEHLDISERGPGKFWCSYCHFECEDNNQMYRHLLSSEHKEVILAINRSVPICISKKLNIDCNVCGLSFRYNVELRQHNELHHPGTVSTGTASDIYQSRFKCDQCGANFSSKIALQRHEKNKHCILKYFCSICNLEFNTPCKARRHRKTLEHRSQAATAKKTSSIKKPKTLTEESETSTKDVAQCNFITSSELEAIVPDASHREMEFSNSSVSSRALNNKESNSPTRKLSKTKTMLVNPIKCKDCDNVFESLHDLRTHRDLKHPHFSHVCMSCGKSFALAQGLGRHTRTCQPKPSKATVHGEYDAEKSWNCENCNFSARYESDLLYHQLFHTYGTLTKQQLVKCPLCTNTYNKYSLRCHLRQHTNEKIFECRFCNVKFSRRHNLKEHISRFHAPKDEQPSTSAAANNKDGGNKNKNAQKRDYQCDTCGKVYSKKYDLKVHSAKHGTAVNNFHCFFEGCRYFSPNKSMLNVHLTSHSQETFKCEQYNCSYIGKSALHLKRHSRSHAAPSKVYTCDKCNFKARSKTHIVRHSRSHTGEKPFQCRYCDFRCSSFSNLRKHVLKTNKHPGKFIYECEMCPQQQDANEAGESNAAIFKTNVYQEFQQHRTDVH